MKFRLVGLGFFICCLVLVSSYFPAAAQAQVRRPLVSPSPTTIATQLSGPHIISGKTVDVTDTLNGDVFVAGQDVTVEGTINGDLLVAAGHVIVKGTVTQNVRVAGGIVELQGTVGGNVAVAAGTLTETRDAKVAGSLTAVSNSTSLFGQVGGQTWLAGTTVSLGGDFAQTVQVKAHTLNVMNGTKIAGDLIAQVTQNPVIGQTTSITGQQKIDQVATPSASFSDKALGKVAGGLVTWVIITSLMALIGGAILLALFPAVGLKLAHQMYDTPVANLGWGFVYLLLVPIIGLMLIVTILGLPLGVLLLLAYVITLILGGWLGAYALGSKIYNPGPLPTYTQQLGQLVIGLVVLQALELIPILGIVVKMVVLMLSLGGIVLVVREAMYNSTIEPLPMSAAPGNLVPLPSEGRQSHSRRSRRSPKTSS